MTNGGEKPTPLKMIAGKFQHRWIGPHGKGGKASGTMDQVKLDTKRFFDRETGRYRFSTGIPVNSAGLGANEKNAGPFLFQAKIGVKSFKYVKIVSYQYGCDFSI
jgi:hypothetical protein